MNVNAATNASTTHAASWITEVDMFFEKTGPVWQTLQTLQQVLRDDDIGYVIVGGMALNVHNYPRQTVEVDVVVSDADFGKFKSSHVPDAYEPAAGAARRFRDVKTSVNVDFLIAGTLAGHRHKNDHVTFPDPSEAEVHEGIATVSLSRLIELKLVTWRFKDWGDVVELIRRNNLDEAFAEQLDELVRSAYLECYDQATSEEYEEPQ